MSAEIGGPPRQTQKVPSQPQDVVKHISIQITSLAEIIFAFLLTKEKCEENLLTTDHNNEKDGLMANEKICIKHG